MKNALGSVDTVLLLGGRSDIGLAIARRLVSGGARRVVLAVRGGGDDEDGVRLLEAAGAKAVDVLPFDAARPETHDELLDAAFDLLEDVDVVISAFGVLGDQAVYEADPDAAVDAVAANFTGHVSLGLRLAARLRAQGHGTLIVLSSVAAVRVRRATVVYGATKAGLDGFAQGLGDALHGSGVHVMVVRPGFVHGKMTAGRPPAPLAVSPDEVAEAVAKGLRAGRELVWAPSGLQALAVVMRMVPRPLWRRLRR